MSIDISNLTYKELEELNLQIKDRKAKLKELCVYEITFHIAFSPTQHENDDLCSPEDFGEWFANSTVYNEIMDTFLLNNTDMTGCEVISLDKEYFPSYFKERIND